MIADIWITLGGTKGVSDIKYCKYKDKTYGPQLRFIQPLLRHFGVDLDNNAVANRLRRVYGTKLYK